PSSVISNIRTSQYSVQPTATSRVVLDLKKAVAYRIEKKGNWIFVYIPDSDCQSFPVWSTNNSKPAVQKNVQPTDAVKPDIKKEMALAPKPTVAIKVEEKKESVPAQKAFVEQGYKSAANNNEWTQEVNLDKNKSKLSSPEYSYQKPESSFTESWRSIEPEVSREPVSNKKETPQQPTPKKTAEPVVQIAAVNPEPEKSPEVTAPSNKETVSVKKTESSSESSENKTKTEEKPEVKKPEIRKTNEVEKSNSNQNLKKVKKSETIKNAKAEPKTSEEVVPVVAQKETDKESSSNKSTSRFRRQPSFSNKMKGTIVAEFPKRLVIKYQAGISRDPFASLIDKEANGENEPNGVKIPDIETSRLVGVLESSEGKNRALLEDVDGYGYILKIGDKVKKGYVSNIYPDKALFQLFEYGWSRTVALRLNQN
ncbi:MAG: hypothetical protein ABIJ45_00900, partial [Candidatus Zixiibacteriota bacterium]